VPVFECEQPVKLRCVETDPRHLSLLELEPGDCRYPYGGDEEGEAITFCDQPCAADSSYCAPHFHLTRGPGRPLKRAPAPSQSGWWWRWHEAGTAINAGSGNHEPFDGGEDFQDETVAAPSSHRAFARADRQTPRGSIRSAQLVELLRDETSLLPGEESRVR
jgi:hypothetical protein